MSWHFLFLLSYAINVVFELYAKIQLWAQGDTDKLYFSEDTLQKMFVVSTLSLHSNVPQVKHPSY